MNSSLFITFEGTEGAGKSTLIKTLAASLQARFQLEVVLTREPGGSPVAEKIRKVILEEPMNSWTELFLYEASRAEHLAKTIRPALAAGKIVLCDRYADSSLAYQAHARGLPWNEVKKLNRIATQGLTPHLTVLLDIDPATGLNRATERTRFEDEGIEFQCKVRQGFLKSMKENPKRWLRIKPAQKTPEQLSKSVIAALIKKFPGKFKRG